ncbi:hypothetical protein L596_009839 [Steinernema carpocapsae]|uniref:Uncharacterized protein n=1 Tax=Steinernema carpocapsae TaxID=34508 RepID=A0A4U5PGH6_STECR|nr:hypothetical protein L596_009839 [Steinernema carpocapsae]
MSPAGPILLFGVIVTFYVLLSSFLLTAASLTLAKTRNGGYNKWQPMAASQITVCVIELLALTTFLAYLLFRQCVSYLQSKKTTKRVFQTMGKMIDSLLLTHVIVQLVQTVMDAVDISNTIWDPTSHHSTAKVIIFDVIMFLVWCSMACLFCFGRPLQEVLRLNSLADITNVNFINSPTEATIASFILKAEEEQNLHSKPEDNRLDAFERPKHFC